MPEAYEWRQGRRHGRKAGRGGWGGRGSKGGYKIKRAALSPGMGAKTSGGPRLSSPDEGQPGWTNDSHAHAVTATLNRRHHADARYLLAVASLPRRVRMAKTNRCDGCVAAAGFSGRALHWRGGQNPFAAGKNQRSTALGISGKQNAKPTRKTNCLTRRIAISLLSIFREPTQTESNRFSGAMLSA